MQARVTFEVQWTSPQLIPFTHRTNLLESAPSTPSSEIVCPTDFRLSSSSATDPGPHQRRIICIVPALRSKRLSRIGRGLSYGLRHRVRCMKGYSISLLRALRGCKFGKILSHLHRSEAYMEKEGKLHNASNCRLRTVVAINVSWSRVLQGRKDVMPHAPHWQLNGGAPAPQRTEVQLEIQTHLSPVSIILTAAHPASRTTHPSILLQRIF